MMEGWRVPSLGAMDVRAVQLMASELTPDGSEYTTLRSFPLLPQET